MFQSLDRGLFARAFKGKSHPSQSSLSFVCLGLILFHFSAVLTSEPRLPFRTPCKADPGQAKSDAVCRASALCKSNPLGNGGTALICGMQPLVPPVAGKASSASRTLAMVEDTHVKSYEDENCWRGRCGVAESH